MEYEKVTETIIGYSYHVYIKPLPAKVGRFLF